MRTSEQIDALSKALAAAQGEMKNAPLNRINPHFKSRYADLAAIRDAVVPPLSKHGLAVTQATSVGEGGTMVLTTRLAHESGQWIESVYPLTPGANPQAMGSQLTYARRYSLSAIAGISADEDDDAEIAAKPGNGVATGPVTQEQVKLLQAMVIEADANLPAYLKALGVERLDDLPASRYQEAVAKLQAKMARQRKPAEAA